jgi:AraC-like DNA-binding protein
MPHGSDLEKDVPPPAFDAGLAAETAAVLDEIAGPGQAIDFLTRNRDFHIRLSSSGPRHVAEHMHENIQISIPLGSTLASVAWRTANGTRQHALARRGHVLIVPARQRHAIAWKNRARFVNIHLSGATASDEQHDFLRRITRLGEAHVIADPFLTRLGEIIVLRAAKRTALDEATLEGFHTIVETHVMHPYLGMRTAVPTPPARSRAAPRGRENSGLAHSALTAIIADIKGDLARDWTVEALAETLGLSAGHFSRSFHRSTGASPRQWIIRQRIDAAMDKLLMTREPLSDIAIACGFAEQAHFTRTFTRLVGTSPGAWRRRYRACE